MHELTVTSIENYRRSEMKPRSVFKPSLIASSSTMIIPRHCCPHCQGFSLTYARLVQKGKMVVQDMKEDESGSLPVLPSAFQKGFWNVKTVSSHTPSTLIHCMLRSVPMYGAWLANAGNRFIGGCLARFMRFIE